MREMKISVFTDAASISEIREYAQKTWISGVTTNPTLMRRSGVENYKSFALEALDTCGGKPLSLEVLADGLDEIVQQGLILGSWGENVFVKVPITTTNGTSCLPAIRELLDKKVKVNVTAVMTDAQTRDLMSILGPLDDVVISVFAGRIADTGVDPVPVMSRYVEWASELKGTKILWASPREVLNVVQAEDCGCDIITVTPELLKRMENLGKSLETFSLETVKMFFDDAVASNLTIS